MRTNCYLYTVIGTIGPFFAMGTAGIIFAANHTAKAEVVPLASVLINAQTRDVYTLPPDTVLPKNESNLSEPRYVFQPSKWNPQLRYTDSLLNLSNTPPADRLQIYTTALMGMMRDAVTLKPDAAYSAKVSALLSEHQEKNAVWPLTYPLSTSFNADVTGAISVFVIRNAEKSGILEKMDVMYFRKGVFVRNYWSRHMNDPQLKESASKAFSKVTMALKKQLKGNSSGLPQYLDSVRFVFDKTVSEKDFTNIELLLKTKDGRPVFQAYEVNKKDIRYRSLIAKNQLEITLDKIKKSSPTLLARSIPGDDPMIQIVPK